MGHRQCSPLSPWRAAGGSRRPASQTANPLPKQRPAEGSGLVSPWCRPAAPYTRATGASCRAWWHRSRGDTFQIMAFRIYDSWKKQLPSSCHGSKLQCSIAWWPPWWTEEENIDIRQQSEPVGLKSDWHEHTHLKSARRDAAARPCTPPPAWLPAHDTWITKSNNMTGNVWTVTLCQTLLTIG